MRRKDVVSPVTYAKTWSLDNIQQAALSHTDKGGPELFSFWDLPSRTHKKSKIYRMSLTSVRFIWFRPHYSRYGNLGQGELSRDVRVGHKMGQIGHKWDKSGTFYDQFQYILVRRSKMYWILILKRIWIILCPTLTSVEWRLSTDNQSMVAGSRVTLTRSLSALPVQLITSVSRVQLEHLGLFTFINLTGSIHFGWTSHRLI